MEQRYLGIGNIINVNGRPTVVTLYFLSELAGEGDDGDSPKRLFQPITLTEEVLRWTEFKEEKGIWSVKGFHGFVLEKPSKGQEYFMAVKYTDPKSYYVVKMHVRYLNELQNMFYFLADRELEIKIPLVTEPPQK